ncbi:MAG: hypothetical protein LRY51_09470 [Geovibrio sp.]|nr:hypothetical protein [Geovibrio sp.]
MLRFYRFFFFYSVPACHSVSADSELRSYADTAGLLAGIIEQKGSYYNSFTADWAAGRRPMSFSQTETRCS